MAQLSTVSEQLSETEQQLRVTEWVTEHGRESFDLSKGPLLSVRLIKLSRTRMISSSRLTY